VEEQPKKWRWGKFRWILLAVIIIQIFVSRWVPPMMPHIQVAPEVVTTWNGFGITNTLIATIIADIVVLLIAFAVYRKAKSGDLVPRGITGVVEGIIEMIYNQTEQTAGKWAKLIFPWFATITLLVLVANWMELLPGVDSFGVFNKEHLVHSLEVKGIHNPEEAIAQKCQFNEIYHGVISVTGAKECAKTIVPFVRVASTDLNFTAALALISVFMTQVIGVKAQGIKYFTKYFNTSTLWTKPAFGTIDFLVGILEIISEFSKILSFSFRLFGNIFAGSVLLFVIGALVPVFIQSGMLVFEFAIGMIQAIVFGMLTMVFMTMATQGHGSEEHHS